MPQFTAEELALAARKLDACNAALKGEATPEQQQFLVQIITDMEVALEQILNRVEFLKDLVTKEQENV